MEISGAYLPFRTQIIWEMRKLICVDTRWLNKIYIICCGTRMHTDF